MNTLHRQRGVSVMLTGLLILILMTVMTIFAVNVSMFEQRSSGNELRAKQAFQSGEAGLSTLLEYIQINQLDIANADDATGWFNAANRQWQPCAANPAVTDPCYEIWDPDTSAWRTYGLGAQMGAGNTVFKYEDGGGNNIMPIPMELTLGSDYQTTALLCLYDPDTNECFDETGPRNNLTIQLISYGESDDDIGQAAVSFLVAPFRPTNTAVDAPLVVASTFAGSGNFTLVPNPNGGGEGVPLSVWSNGDVSLAGAGSAQSCNVAEYFQGGNPDYTTMVCLDCDCPAATEALLTFDANDGIDVLDVDGDLGPIPDSTNFPDDVFSYVLTFESCDYLEVRELAKDIGALKADCSDLPPRGGLVWVDGTCNMTGAVGSVTAPYLIIAAGGDAHLAGGAEFYGMLFATTIQLEDIADGGCSTADCTSLTGDTGLDGSMCPRADLASRPDLDLAMNGTNTAFGAIITDKDVDLGNGSLDLVYNELVLQNLANIISYSAWGQLPGTWQDFASNN
jgi:hypothetical protein